MRGSRLLLLVLLGFGPGACSRTAREHAPAAVDTATVNAILRDRPPTLVVPFGGARVGSLIVSGVALKRDELPRATAEVAPDTGLGALPPPAAEPDEPPATAPSEATPSGAASSAPSSPPDVARRLEPPVPLGAPELVSGGRGGRVTLDVRVDENGDVSDALFVASDADSLTVSAATAAALRLRFHPARLGGHPTAVWTRQVFDVRRGGKR